MPIDTALATKVWYRYAWARDNGHSQFVEKADRCEAFFRGEQWSKADKAKLQLSRRPALTINKIISTMANVMGEQIYNRSEIAFRPRSGANPKTAEILTKVFKQISDNNQLDWARSDCFADGIITSRGFLDVRIGFNDSLQGEVVIDNLNPKNVIVDPDGESYDPDTWKEVFVTKWVSADDIAILYNKADAELLRNREQSFFPYGYDSIQSTRDRFGDRFNPMYNGTYDESSVMRNIRVIERQHKKLHNQKHFVAPATGDMRPIPDDFDDARIRWFVEKFGFQVVKKLVQRIRWTVIADNIRLHDDWSPYKHFTVVPYFPYFRHGATIGLVENLLGPQELLNKVSSQELHVVNTTANSGWKMKAGALTNMSAEELEMRGAETGLVLEVNGDPEKDLVKIQPNQVPQGLDRVSYKAEEHIKGISGVSDSMQGFDREDVAAKAIQAKRQAGSTNLVKPLDSLTRSDYVLARNVLDLVQQFYTEERVLTITHDALAGTTETFTINGVDEATGEVVNDLMLGEYDVVISSVPQRETLEDSQFEQAMAMREQGIQIPDRFLIENSRLIKKSDLVKAMDDQANSPEAQAQAMMQQRAQAAEVSKLEGEAASKHADAGLKEAKKQSELVKAHKEASTPPEDNGIQAKMMETQADIELDERKFQHEMSMEERKLAFEFGLRRQEFAQDQRLKEQQAAVQRAATVQQAQQPAGKPANTPKQGLRA